MKRIVLDEKLDKKLDFNFIVDFFQLDFQENFVQKNSDLSALQQKKLNQKDFFANSQTLANPKKLANSENPKNLENTENTNASFFASTQNLQDFQKLKSRCFYSFTNDTRYLQKGDIFFALNGVNSKASDFIDKAISLSASLVLVQYDDLIDSNNSNSTNKNLQLAKIDKIADTFIIYAHNFQERIGDFLAEILQINQAPNQTTYSQNQSQKNQQDQQKQVFDIYAVTGTNGKTSIAHFLAQTWQNLGYKACIIGTIGNGELGKLNATINTTPDIFTLYNLLFQWKKSGVQKVVMEASSHALVQKRLAGLNIKTAIFSNLSQDHLDYHQNMQAYGEAKKLLFQDYSVKNACINLDDEFGAQLISQLQTKMQVLSFSKTNADANLFLQRQELKNGGLAGSLVYKNKTHKTVATQAQSQFDFQTKIVGAFNFENLMALIGVLLLENQKNINLEKIIALLMDLKPVLGRMELLSAIQVLQTSDLFKQNQAFFEQSQQIQKIEQLPKVVIDYAHTPDALQKALESVKLHTSANLICVFGAGGDRDKGKRPLMAQVASKIADKIFITDDNPRTEDPAQIRAEILAGLSELSELANTNNTTNTNNTNNLKTEKKATCQVVEIGDRKQAISQAITGANSNDWILIAGKGHEDYQIIGTEKTHFSDREVASLALQDLLHLLLKK